jgi:SOS-response transcriptional repressor LexA
MNLANNLRTWREAASMSREQLAERIGVSPVSVYRIELGRQQPRPGLLEAIGRVFSKEPAEFYGDASNVSLVSGGNRRIPVVDSVPAGDINILESTLDPNNSVPTDLNPSAQTFMLRIRGRSMEPDFSEGDLVMIDPAVAPRAEDFVAAIDERGEGTFRRYHDLGINDQGVSVFELVPLNGAYPSWRSDRKKIMLRGTMIEHRRFRKP